jgi:hypothetical protein
MDLGGSSAMAQRTVIRPRLIVGIGMLIASLGLPSVAAPASASASKNLVQTRVEPSFAAPLTARMHRLFHAISADSPSLGASLFFPRSAYFEMKVGLISNPSADYRDRLVALFNLDLHSYHQLLLAHPASFLVRVNANPRLATWIAPGACENRIGYWHVPGVRLVVSRNHRTVSVAVFSLISWRGVWYVVHLGPNPRPRDVGTVAGFAPGPGTPGPGGGC